MKTLVVLTSPPACGKSTWAKNYQARHENVFIVSSDALREELTGCTDDFSKQQDVWALFDKRISEKCLAGGENVTVIADSLMDLNSLRVEIVKKHPEFDRFVLIYFFCTKEDSLRNNQNRPKQFIVPDDAMERLWAKFEKPDIATLEYYNDYLRIIGNFKQN